MVNRELEMKNKGLYTKEQLKDYNRRKNDVSSHQERYNVFSIGKI